MSIVTTLHPLQPGSALSNDPLFGRYARIDALPA